MRNGTSQSPFRTRSSTADCAPAVPVTGTPSQHRFARCDSVASSRDDSTPRSDARFVSPLALTHVGYTVSPRGFRGLTASAFSLPWRSAFEDRTPAERRASMTWAQRLKRVFGIDIETCPACGGAVKVVACIEDPVLIKRILDHLKQKAEANEPRPLPESRAPPTSLFA